MAVGKSPVCWLGSRPKQKAFQVSVLQIDPFHTGPCLLCRVLIPKCLKHASVIEREAIKNSGGGCESPQEAGTNRRPHSEIPCPILCTTPCRTTSTFTWGITAPQSPSTSMASCPLTFPTLPGKDSAQLNQQRSSHVNNTTDAPDENLDNRSGPAWPHAQTPRHPLPVTNTYAHLATKRHRTQT